MQCLLIFMFESFIMVVHLFPFKHTDQFRLLANKYRDYLRYNILWLKWPDIFLHNAVKACTLITQFLLSQYKNISSYLFLWWFVAHTSHTSIIKLKMHTLIQLNKISIIQWYIFCWATCIQLHPAFAKGQKVIHCNVYFFPNTHGAWVTEPSHHIAPLNRSHYC